MEGARGRFSSEGEMAAAALNAGVDLLLDIADPVATVDYLAQQVDRGELSLDKIHAAVKRILALKSRMAALPVGPSVTTEEFRQQSQQVAADVARRAIRYVASDGPSSKPLFSATESITTLLFKPFDLPTDPAEQPLAAALRAASPGAQYFEIGPASDPQLVADCLAAARDSDRLLLAIIAKPAAWHAFGMTPDHEQLVNQLVTQAGTVVASLGVPTILERFPSEIPKLCTF